MLIVLYLVPCVGMCATHTHTMCYVTRMQTAGLLAGSPLLLSGPHPHIREEVALDGSRLNWTLFP